MAEAMEVAVAISTMETVEEAEGQVVGVIIALEALITIIILPIM